MTTEDIQAFRDFVLEQNTYLANGYAPAFIEEGRVLVKDKSDFINVTITDNLGAYFYLRYDGDITFPAERGNKVTDCGPGRVGFIDTAPMVMVVVMNNADPYALLNNMRNTCLSYTEMAVVPTGAQLVREIVVVEEMSGADEGDVQQALAALDRQAIIKVRLTVAKSYRPNTCIVDPCSCI